MNLPITVVAIDCLAYAHDLMMLSLADTLRHIDPEHVLIFTDAPDRGKIEGAEYVWFSGGIKEVLDTLWYRVPQLIVSDHWLWVQWDSGVINPGAWTDDFLQYDYIGAPWPCDPGGVWHDLGYTPGRNVGNGGFSLRSAALSRYLAAHRRTCPIVGQEDDAICRLYRPALEETGLVWAPEELARQFSFEFGHEVPYPAPFGYHNSSNWLWALSEDERQQRIRAAPPLIQNHPAFSYMSRIHNDRRATDANL